MRHWRRCRRCRRYRDLLVGDSLGRVVEEARSGGSASNIEMALNPI